MPRLTRAQAALQDAAATADATKLQYQREPFEEVNANVESKQLAKPRTTRARSKAGTRKENYDVEEPVVVPIEEDTKSSSSINGASARSTRSTRTRSKKMAETVVQDEVQIEVIITRSTRSTKRGGKHQQQQQEEEAVAVEQIVLTPDSGTNLEVKEVLEKATPLTSPTVKTVTRATRATRKPTADVEPTARRTRRQAAIAGRDEQILDNEDSAKSPIQPRGRPNLKVAASPSRIPSPIKGSPAKQSITTPVASPVQKVQSNAVPVRPTVTPTVTPTVGKSPSPIRPRHLVVSPGKPIAKSAGQKVAEVAKTKSPARLAAAVLPVSKRIAAVENQSNITPMTLGNRPATAIIHSKLISPEKSVQTKATVASTPIRPAAPMSLTSIKKAQTQTPGRTFIFPANATPSRPSASPTKFGTPVLNRIAPKVPTTTPANTKRIITIASPIKMPSTPTAVTKAKPTSLGSPFVPPLKPTPRMPSISMPLGSFASPTKSHLARQSLAVTSRPVSGDEGASSHGTSMVVNISKLGPELQSQVAPGTEVTQKTPKKAAVLPPVLRKKAPVVATTRAALLRARKASGQSEPIPIELAKKSEPVKAPVPQLHKAAIQEPPKAVVSRPKVAAATDTKSVTKPTKGTVLVNPIMKSQRKVVSAPLAKAPPPTILSGPIVESQREKAKGVARVKIAVTIPTISISTPESEVTPQIKPTTSTRPNVAASAAVKPLNFANPVGDMKAAEPKKPESDPVKAPAPKPVTQKKPFQPVKSTKPPTIPVEPFQRSVGILPTVSATKPLQKPVGIVSSIKDRIRELEAPKPKPKPTFVEARTLLREARKEARKGTLPVLTGEVEYIALPELEEQPQVSVQVSTPASVAVPDVESITQPLNKPLSRPVSPLKSVASRVVISGLDRPISPVKPVLSEELESMKRAKERAEASLRGHQAVLNWASKARPVN
ncbi:hypothetical protein TWF694_001671 [Orbilia ellipsospora]|uniref:Uncharacterized protein n=1 Tax=Orbilia ellipsospora TaxID=2528407 RepID=A0AAV9X3C2_9PEZI